MRRALLLFLTVAACGAGPMGCTVAPATGSSATLERGRYMVLTGHCNNCHTAGYVAASGRIPEDRWLMGNPVGWRSKQGTTYGTNLRLYVQNLSAPAFLPPDRVPPRPYQQLPDMS
jgi:mono/diheme cytochrome c family protein